MRLPRFIPILTALTERVANCEMDRLLQSPTALARALADTQAAVGHDGVLCVFDPLLLQSACLGAAGPASVSDAGSNAGLMAPEQALKTAPLATILDAIEPLRHHLRGAAAVFTTFAGPGLLHRQLRDAIATGGQAGEVGPEYAVNLVRSAVRCSLENHADGVALIEQAASPDPEPLRRCRQSVRKLADFYDAAFIVFNLPGDGEVATDSPAHAVFDLADPGAGTGPLQARAGRRDAARPDSFTTTADIPAETDIAILRAMLSPIATP